MSKIFFGFLFIFLDFDLNIDACKIGLIPDFIGYIILYNGLCEMSRYSEKFVKAKPFTVGMGIYSAILYIIDIFGISTALGYLVIPLGIASIAVSLYISYLIILGIKQIEADNVCFLNGDKLMTTWKLLAIFQLLSYLLFFVPVISIVAIIVSFIVAIIFLIVFNQSRKLFEAMPPDNLL